MSGSWETYWNHFFIFIAQPTATLCMVENMQICRSQDVCRYACRSQTYVTYKQTLHAESYGLSWFDESEFLLHLQQTLLRESHSKYPALDKCSKTSEI